MILPDRCCHHTTGTGDCHGRQSAGQYIGPVSTTELELFYKPQVARLDNRGDFGGKALVRRKHPRLKDGFGPWEVLDLLQQARRICGTLGTGGSWNAA